MENEIFNKALNLLKEQDGYNPAQNISDYWFGNKAILTRKLNEKWPWYAQTFDLLIRWHSEIGCECRKKIIDFIKKMKEKALEESYKELETTGCFSFRFAVVDFEQFSFIFNGVKYNLTQFARRFEKNPYVGIHDLRGIDLSNIDIRDCEFRNCFFVNANFENAYFHQCIFYNCRFTEANFDNASLINIRYDSNSSFGNISAQNTFFNAIDLKGFSNIRNIKVPSYRWLLIEFFKNHKKSKMISKNKNNTVFWFVQTESNTDFINAELISYVNWYQYVTKKICNKSNESFINNTKFFLALVTTKYWTSCQVLILFSIIVNIVYSILYFLLGNGFHYDPNIIRGDWWDYLYFSFVTFTTLGFGDITPINHVNQLLVMSEVTIGYTVLGIFIFLISKKISKLQL